jgi:two-component system cell cycle sensor histidine kinase/response regulator CckA
VWGETTDDLSLTSARVKALLEHAPLILLVYDPDYRIRYISRVVQGAQLERVLGSSALDHIAEPSRPAFVQAFSRVIHDQEIAECQLAGASGRWWLLRLAPLLHEGQVRQVVACSVELTAQKSLQDQVAQKHKNESLGTMASGIAHDFNNLLTTILCNTSLARQLPEIGAEGAQLLGEVETAAQRAAEICAQMLTYAGGDRSRRAPGNLNQVIRQIAPLTRAATGANIALAFDLAQDLPTCGCDGAQLGQVILNLINNAADAIGSLEGRIDLVTDSVLIGEQSPDYRPSSPIPGHYLRLQVADDGPGMTAETLERIFDPFYSTKATGHGLGLSVVLGIAASNNAAIKVESRVGVGTTMTVLFPTYEAGTSVQPEPSPRSATTDVTGTILVVDDQPAIRRLAANVLRNAGYEVLVAEDGAAALSVLGAHGGRLQAVVLDLGMPARSGRETLAELRKRYPHLPVVLSSGGVVRRIPADPFVRFLAKPYAPAQLTAVVAEAIQDQRRYSSIA